MAFPQKPNDLYVVNGWYLELPGLVSPHFETLDGLQKVTGTVDIVDAGTNIKYKFPSQIIDYGDLTLTRTMKGDADDKALQALVNECIENGLKVSGVLVKLHHTKEVFRLAFVGFRFVGMTYPSWDVNGEEKFLVSYTATVDYWLNV